MTIEIESAARFGLGNPGKDGTPQMLHLDGGAALVDVKPPSDRHGAGRAFQIQTPHAIASVRGTQWVVDPTPTMTAVFVARGSVGVAPREGGSEVVLAPGDGVDVQAAGGNLTVVRWGERRVRATLARFGR